MIRPVIREKSETIPVFETTSQKKARQSAVLLNKLKEGEALSFAEFLIYAEYTRGKSDLMTENKYKRGNSKYNLPDMCESLYENFSKGNFPMESNKYSESIKNGWGRMFYEVEKGTKGKLDFNKEVLNFLETRIEESGIPETNKESLSATIKIISELANEDE